MCEPPLCGSKRTSTSKCVVLRSRHIWWIQAWVFRKSQRFSGWRQACSQQLRMPSGSFELNCSRNYVPRAENKSSSDVLMNEKHIFLMFNPLANHFLYGCLKWEPWFISGKGHKPRGSQAMGRAWLNEIGIASGKASNVPNQTCGSISCDDLLKRSKIREQLKVPNEDDKKIIQSCPNQQATTNNQQNEIHLKKELKKYQLSWVKM